MGGNEVLARVSRNERRLLLETERKRRQTGAWPPWEKLSIPRGTAGKGWAAEFTTVHRNWVFSVLERTLPDGTRHLMIASLTQTRPTWHEAQRIKSEIAGAEATAVEVYPPDAEIVDDADAYHLWVLPNRLPFTLSPLPPSTDKGEG